MHKPSAAMDNEEALALKKFLNSDSQILKSIKDYCDAAKLERTLIKESPCCSTSSKWWRRGMMVGRLIYYADNDRIDCSEFGGCGWSIPVHIDSLHDMESDALFILLVEKDAAFHRLAEDRFYNRFPCFIITTAGEKNQPDVATRRFVKKIKDKFNLPVFALVDCDPHGLNMLSFYMCGSGSGSKSTMPDIKWLGLRPSDLDKYKISEYCWLPMAKQDIKTIKEFVEKDFVKKNPRWIEELNTMVEMKHKVETEALSSLGIQFLTEVFLPLKLQQMDWI